MKNTLAVRVRIGVFELDLKSGELRNNGDKTVLREQPLQILRMLTEREGELVAREEIRKKLWPNDTIVEFDHSINAAINKLRKALGDSADEPKYVETVARRGYRLVVPVEWVSVEDSPTPTLSPKAGEKGGAPAPSPKPGEKEPAVSLPKAGAPAEGSPDGVVAQVAGGAGVAAAALPDPGGLTGRTVSHYRVLEIIGGGGMGVVYRSEDLKLGRQVALKFLPEELGNEPEVLERFSREARAVSSLDHPNICSIFEFGEHEGRSFMVMQLLEGETLRDRLAAAAEAQTALPLEELLDIALQVSDGLKAAHERGIIHRDIKPANIFITERGVCKILDFGIAKLTEGEPPASTTVDLSSRAERVAVATSEVEGPAVVGALENADPSTPCPPGRKNAAGKAGGHSAQDDSAKVAGPPLTRAGLAMGTAGYMSPEQVRGEKLDARTDLFSFGLILYEMATGQRAFSGETTEIVHNTIVHQPQIPVHDLNPKLPPELGRIINKALEKDREQRYQSATDMLTDLKAVETVRPAQGQPRGTPFRKVWVVGAVLLGLAAISIYFYLHQRQSYWLNEADLILVSDFVNTTGEPIFDGTLKQALTVKLAESPYFNIVPESRTRQILGLMGRSPDERLVPSVAREVCRREGAKVVVGGSIVSLGSKYVLDLDATNCLTGASIAHQRIEALNREQVLSKLGRMIPPLRRQLGDSVSSIQKFDTSIEQATTASLAALKAYTSGDEKRTQGQEAESIPFYKMAVELDPDFAMAYAKLAAVYTSLSQPDLADEYLQKAFERREHVSEREKFYIQARYYSDTAKDNDKEIEIYKLWSEAYPHDFVPLNGLTSGYIAVGQLEKAIEAGRQALRVNPDHALPYASLARAYERASRFAEAKAICEKAIAEKVDSFWTHQVLYRIAFAEGDSPAMQREIDWFKGKSQESVNTYYQAKAALSRGDLSRSREFFDRARTIALGRGLKEQAVAILNSQAQFEADLGNTREARTMADLALRTMPNSLRHKAFATLAMARAGDTRRAEALINELNNQPSFGTALNNVVLPSIRAGIELNRKNPAAALEELRPAIPYDLGTDSAGVTLYYRGLAYLELKSGGEAAAQFQDILDNRGVVICDIYWPLAHLGLARAYALDAAKDPAARDKARTAYQNFLTLWKDADPDIPIYKQAKAEYAKLQ